MSCCGQKRRALQSAPRATRTAPPPAKPELRNPQPLRHTGGYSLVVKGPVTGQTYLFGARDIALTVDDRDAQPLIATGRFALAPY
jgi:hypothetical protein